MISFHGKTVAELRSRFKAAVTDHLEDCESQELAPGKPASGKLLLRVPPEVHSEALIAAQARGRSLDQWAAEALQRAVAADGSQPSLAGRALAGRKRNGSRRPVFGWS